MLLPETYCRFYFIAIVTSIAFVILLILYCHVLLTLRRICAVRVTVVVSCVSVSVCLSVRTRYSDSTRD